jgi:predicted P-loop ATPase
MGHIQFNPEGVPESLKQHPRFLAYALLPGKNGKLRKVPQRLDANGSTNSSAQDSSNWLAWSKVEALRESGTWQYFGWSFNGNSTGIVGLDLDGCRNPETGDIETWAIDLLQAFGSYSEISPSGCGLHIWLRIIQPSDSLSQVGKQVVTGRDQRRLEIFSTKLWMTLTGAQPAGCPWTELRSFDEGSFWHVLKDGGFDGHCSGDPPRSPSDPSINKVPVSLVVEALRYVSNDDYDSWIRVGIAINNEYGDHGFDIWSNWSSSSEKYDQGTARKKWLSFKRASRLRVGAATILWLARRAGWRPRLRSDWVRRLRRTKNGPIPDEANVLLCLELDPFLQDLVAYDSLSQRLVALRSTTPGAHGTSVDSFPRDWQDSDTVDLLAYLQTALFPRLSKERVDASIRLFGQKYRSFNPLQDYLLALTWDGKPRIGTWLEVYWGAGVDGQDMEYVRAIGQAWAVSAVARALKPGCQADHVLVFEGPQGCGKTTALRTLGGTYFTDSLPHDLSHKDASDHLRGVWIVELAELTQLKKSAMEFVKSFVSRCEERFRPAYGRHEVRYPRSCVFAGTTNESQHLIDNTGNRRFWSVSVRNVDVAALRRDRDQLWAEAVELYSQGVSWHLDASLSEKAKAEADARVMADPWLHRVAEAVDRHPLDLQDAVLPGEVLCEIASHEQAQTPQNARRVGFLLKQLGWMPGKRTKKGQLYLRPEGHIQHGGGGVGVDFDAQL